MSEYLLKIKSTVDSLIAVGYDMNNNEHVESILDGLSSDYDAFITSVSTRLDPFTISEIEAHLLAQETRIEKNQSENMLYANLANMSLRNGNFRNQYSTNSNQSNNRNQYANTRNHYQNMNPNYNSRGRSNSQNRGRGRRGYNGNYFGRALVTCQICNKVGHLAYTCFFRYDQSSSGQNQKQHSVQIAAVNQESEPNTDGVLPWFPNSGASTHVTSYYSNIHFGVNYNGQDKLHMGDGTGIPIQHIGHAFVQSPFNPSTKLSLFNILHVPNISKHSSIKSFLNFILMCVLSNHRILEKSCCKEMLERMGFVCLIKSNCPI